MAGICALARPWQSLVIGLIGGLLAVSTSSLLVKLKIDDPVGVFPVHGVSAIWAMLSIGLFADMVTLFVKMYTRKPYIIKLCLSSLRINLTLY